MRRRPTVADRPEFRRQLREAVTRLGIQPAKITQDVTIVCTRADEFDPADNVLWELEGNKSAVRQDVHCLGCRSPMAMSNYAYMEYSTLDKKPKVYCLRCMVEANK